MRGFIKQNTRKKLDKEGKLILDEKGKPVLVPIPKSFRIAVSIGRDRKTGKYEYIWETFHGTKSKAEERLAQLLDEHSKGILRKPGKQTLAGYLDDWLKGCIKPNLSPRTAEGYEQIINKHLIPEMGSIPLAKLDADTIDQYYSDKLASGLSNTTVNHHHTCLHGALKNAVKKHLIQINPDDATNPPKPQDREMQTMSETEIHLFLEMARETRYYTLFYLALFTGLRRGELLGLKWTDIDLLDMTLSVNRSLYQLADGEIIIRNPKTDKSRRLVSLTPSTCDVLRQELAKQKATLEEIIQKKKEAQKTEEAQSTDSSKKEEDSWSDDHYIFSEWDAKHFLPNSISHAWQKLAKKSGIHGVRLHDSRHSHATLMLKAGIHPKIVSERLGHSSITVTLDTYSHVVPGLQQAAANKFDDLLLPKEKVQEVDKLKN